MVEEYLGIVIDYSRDALLPEQGICMLTKKGFYKKDHEESPQQTFARASTCYSFGDYSFAQRIYDAASKGYFTFASPVLSNAVEVTWPTFNEGQFEEASDWLSDNVDPEGMPISCFLSRVGDKRESLVETRKETAWLSMMGGGIGVGMHNRSPDEKSTGVLAHLKGYDADALAYKQTSSRRGSIASYLGIEHPEIKNFISMRNPVGGDSNKKCFNLNNGVNLPDAFMEAVIAGNDWELVDPKHGSTGRTLPARELFEDILDARYETGEPYCMFIDTVNRNLPKQITKATYHVSQSNLCSEITLMTSDKRTAVCCLSSLNMEKFEEWKDTGLVADLVRLLDNVLEYFIRLAPPVLSRAVYSASKERAIGVGTLGWHSYLQRKRIPFDSFGFNSAAHHTEMLYSELKKQGEEESKRLGSLRGEPSDVEGSGFRNSHIFAIAPNASSSSIIGVSPSIEPWASNAFNAQGRAGSFLIKNKYLEEELEKLGINNKATWDDIIASEGSVQHLEIPDEIKAVFKTAREINPTAIIEMAALRQPFICQSQSLNIQVGKNITKQEMAIIHILAWKKGVKTLYYCRAEASGKVSLKKTGVAQPLNRVKVEYNECRNCEG